MKKISYIAKRVLPLFVAAGLLCGFMPASDYAMGKGKIKAATYFGKEWPINFWSAEHETAAEDFRKIREDGFNSIILCVPWREFQPYVKGVKGASYFQEYALSLLRTLFSEAEKAGLSVMLRLGYTWDFCDTENVTDRYKELMYEESVQEAWLLYAKKIYEEVSKFPNFAGAFLTWEDFWNFVETVKNTESAAERRLLADRTDYGEYLRAHYSEEELLQFYGNENDAKNLPFPDTKSPAYRLFMEWYDEKLNELLLMTQTVFPELSMECRLDMDPYNGTDGTVHGFSHEKTFAAGNASYSATMLSVSMGYPDGTVLDPVNASDMSAAQIGRFCEASGKPLFVDQFLYMETTPGYENLAKLPAEAVNVYLARMGHIFRNNTMGYGIWTYRDYADSVIYNPGFALGLSDWNKSGSVSVIERDGNKMAKLSKGSVLSQDLSGRNYLSEGNTKAELRVITEEATALSLSVGSETRRIELEAGDQVVRLEYEKQNGQKISIAPEGEMLIDDIKVYAHVTEGGIYRLDGSEGPYLAGIRECNANLR